MAKWVECTEENGRKIWINLDNVTNMARHEMSRPVTEVILVGGGQIYAQERPEDIIHK
jgi:hypothetical protein